MSSGLRDVGNRVPVESIPEQVSRSALECRLAFSESPSTAMRRTRIVLADDQRMFREALHALIDAERDLQVVGEAASGSEAVALTLQLDPDILLLNVSMHGDGIEALRQLASSPSNTRIIVLTNVSEKPVTVAALRLGVRGLVLKESGLGLLLRALRGVRDGQLWVAREVVSEVLHGIEATAGTAGRITPQANFGLTIRELQIVSAVVTASGNKEIAQQFEISEKTVKHHLTNIFDKVGVSNRLELALFALHHRLVTPVDN